MAAIARGTATKLRARDLVDGEFVRGASRMEPNRLITILKEDVSRVRVLGTVVSRYVSEDRKYGSITLDDATETIAVRTFREELELLERIKPGDIVDVIGKVKEYEGERYVSPESIWQIRDPNWELVRKLELLLKEKRLREKVGQVEAPPSSASPSQATEAPAVEVVEEAAEGKEERDPKEMVLELVERLGEKDGIKYVTLLQESGLAEEKLEGVLNELMGEGEIYEPKIGRFKRV